MKQPPKPQPIAFIPLRGPSGRLYGYLDARTMIIEFKRGGQVAERIDLKPLITPEDKKP